MTSQISDIPPSSTQDEYNTLIQKLSFPPPQIAPSALTCHNPKSECIFLTGSVGKTSTALQLESILLRQGIRVASYLGDSQNVTCHSSASLQHWYFTIRENIRIDGQVVSKEEFTTIMSPVAQDGSELRPTMRQAALEYFLNCEVDFIIMEGSTWPWKNYEPAAVIIMPVEDAETFNYDVLDSQDVRIYSAAGQNLELLKRLSANSIQLQDSSTNSSITEQNRSFADRVAQDLLRIADSLLTTSNPFNPCRMEELQWNESNLLLDQASCSLSVQQLAQYAAHHFSHCSSIIFVMGLEQHCGTQDDSRARFGRFALDILEQMAFEQTNISHSILFLRSNQTSALDTQWLEEYTENSCPNLHLISLGLRNYSEEGRELLESYNASNTAIVCFGSPHLVAELRRILVRKKAVTHSTPEWCLKPDRHFEYEKDRLLVKYMKQNALLQGTLCYTHSFGWILQFLRGHDMRYLIGSNFGLNNSCAAEMCRDKAATSTILQMHKIPHVEHLIFVNPNQSEFHSATAGGGSWDGIKRCFEKLNRNVVVKPKEGSEGEGVVHVTTQRELEVQVHGLFSQYRDFCICPFYDIASEIRCIMLDHECLLMYRKMIPCLVGDGHATKLELFLEYEKQHKSLLNRESKGGAQIPEVISQDPFTILPKDARLTLSWKFNLSGGHMLVEPMSAQDFPQHLRMAQSATKALRLRFASVDLIETKSGELRVLEVNSCVWLSKFALRQSAEGGSEIARQIYGDALRAMFLRGAEDA